MDYFSILPVHPLTVVFACLFPDLRPPMPKKAARRLLKKEVSLDTYTWQKKYGQLTSSIMMAAVDERLKRRFSVSASMEEISKCKAAGVSATESEQEDPPLD